LADTFLKDVGLKWRFQFPPHPAFVSTLPGETKKCKFDAVLRHSATHFVNDTSK